MQAQLPDGLLSLDIARPPLARLMRSDPIAVECASVGNCLAAARWPEEGDATRVLAALALSGVPKLPAAPTTRPARAFLHAFAEPGRLDLLRAALAASASPAADKVHAGILEQAKGLPAAGRAIEADAATSMSDTSSPNVMRGRFYCGVSRMRRWMATRRRMAMQPRWSLCECNDRPMGALRGPIRFGGCLPTTSVM
jgi:hypothetical protein